MGLDLLVRRLGYSPSTLRIQHLELSGSFLDPNLIKNWDTSFVNQPVGLIASIIGGAFQSGFGFRER